MPGCLAGGADRLALVAPGPLGEDDGRSPEPAMVSAVVRASDLPVRVVLRLDDSPGLSGGGLARLAALAEEYVALGAEGVVFGFLDADLRVDIDTCRALLERLPGVPWTFDRAVDDALDPARAWADVLSLRGVTAVRTGGAARGLDHGFEALLGLLRAQPAMARVLMPGAGLRAEQVPWFARAGVGQFHLGLQARPGESLRAYVDADYVRSWRTLLDDQPPRRASS